MKYYKFISITLLTLGLIFSVFAGFHFNWHNGFEFKSFWIRSMPNLLDIAFVSSGETLLRSNTLGHIFYLTFAILYLKQNPTHRKSAVVIAFLILIGLVFINDIYAIYQDINHEYIGRHFRIGLIVFILGVLSYRKALNKDSRTI